MAVVEQEHKNARDELSGIALDRPGVTTDAHGSTPACGQLCEGRAGCIDDLETSA
jgi:hypothetical protein